MKESQPVKPWHIIFSVVYGSMFPAAFFVLAGDFKWIEGWIFTIILLAWGSALMFYLVKKDPELLRERLVLPIQKEKKEGKDIQQKGWDKPIIAILFIFFAVWIVGTPLDAKRFGLSPEFPVLVKVIGAIFLNSGLAIALKTLMDNPFAASVARVQKDRRSKTKSCFNRNLQCCETSSLFGGDFMAYGYATFIWLSYWDWMHHWYEYILCHTSSKRRAYA